MFFISTSISEVLILTFSSTKSKGIGIPLPFFEERAIISFAKFSISKLCSTIISTPITQGRELRADPVPDRGGEPGGAERFVQERGAELFFGVRFAFGFFVANAKRVAERIEFSAVCERQFFERGFERAAARRIHDQIDRVNAFQLGNDAAVGAEAEVGGKADVRADIRFG